MFSLRVDSSGVRLCKTARPYRYESSHRQWPVMCPQVCSCVDHGLSRRPFWRHPFCRHHVRIPGPTIYSTTLQHTGIGSAVHSSNSRGRVISDLFRNCTERHDIPHHRDLSAAKQDGRPIRSNFQQKRFDAAPH